MFEKINNMIFALVCSQNHPDLLFWWKYK